MSTGGFPRLRSVRVFRRPKEAKESCAACSTNATIDVCIQFNEHSEEDEYYKTCSKHANLARDWLAEFLRTAAEKALVALDKDKPR